MFGLIKSLNRLAKAQEEANRLNREFMQYKKAQDEEAKQRLEEIDKYNSEVNEKSYTQNEEFIDFVKNNLQQNLERAYAAMTQYVDAKFKELENGNETK